MQTLTGSPSGPHLSSPALATYEAVTRLAKFGVWEFDIASERIAWSDGVYDMFGVALETKLKRAEVIAQYVDESRATLEFMRGEAIRTGESFALDCHIRTRRDDMRWIRIWLDVARDDSAAPRIFGAKQDITAERAAFDRLRTQAEHDPLTGLGNRGLFDAHYREMIADPLNCGGVAALALIDLDHFKQVNDAFGHAAGDECLRRTADRLRRVFGEARLVARIGGDEFAVLMRAPLGEARIRQMLQRASALLAKPIIRDGRRLDIGASIGVTILGRPHRRRLGDLFAEADAALYAAKTSGRGHTRIFGDISAPQAVRA